MDSSNERRVKNLRSKSKVFLTPGCSPRPMHWLTPAFKALSSYSETCVTLSGPKLSGHRLESYNDFPSTINCKANLHSADTHGRHCQAILLHKTCNKQTLQADTFTSESSEVTFNIFQRCRF